HEGDAMDRRAGHQRHARRQAHYDALSGVEQAGTGRRSAETERDRVAEQAAELPRNLENAHAELSALRAKVTDAEMTAQNLQHAVAAAGQEADESRRRAEVAERRAQERERRAHEAERRAPEEERR